MTVIGSDSIATGKVSQPSKRLPSISNRVHRGFTVCSSGTASIPSRYLTIITSNNEKRGFQQTAKRFHYDPSFSPGPGQYETIQALNKQLERTSDSKRGTGSFASKSKRESFLNVRTNVPAPTSYNIAGVFGHEHQDFNRSKYSSMFQKPIAERPISPKSFIPSPNQYDINQGLKSITRSNNVTAQAAFRSHTNRSVAPSKHLITPAPGAYNLDDSVTRSLGPSHHSSFKSTSKRETFSVHSGELPGPADYQPSEKHSEELHRQLFPRRNYLTISAPAIPPPAEAPYPGPGAYDIRDFKDAEKKYMSTSVFVSSTSRWTGDATVVGDQPGPASYTPRAPMKQSFNFNFERKWL